MIPDPIGIIRRALPDVEGDVRARSTAIDLVSTGRAVNALDVANQLVGAAWPRIHRSDRALRALERDGIVVAVMREPPGDLRGWSMRDRVYRLREALS